MHSISLINQTYVYVHNISLGTLFNEEITWLLVFLLHKRRDHDSSKGGEETIGSS